MFECRVATSGISGAPASHAVPVARCLVLAVGSLLAASGLYLGVLVDAGFPDGHLSAYQRWAAPFQWAALAGLLVIAAGSIVRAIARTPARDPTRLFRRAVLAAIVLTLAAFVLVPVIGLDVLHLENGQGG